MSALTKVKGALPTFFDDFFSKPWNEWFDGNGLLQRTLTVPAVNIEEENNHYKASLAVPGMNKDDFRIDVEGDILTISAEKEEKKEEKDKKYTRKEYNYSSFTRNFTLPEEVKKDNIDARYTNGVLELILPKKEVSKERTTQKIPVN